MWPFRTTPTPSECCSQGMCKCTCGTCDAAECNHKAVAHDQAAFIRLSAVQTLPSNVQQPCGLHCCSFSSPRCFVVQSSMLTRSMVLCHRVLKACAAHLGITVGKLLLWALYERQVTSPAPMLACSCEDAQAILQIHEIAQQVECHSISCEVKHAISQPGLLERARPFVGSDAAERVSKSHHCLAML